MTHFRKSASRVHEKEHLCRLIKLRKKGGSSIKIEENLVYFIRQTFHKLLYTRNARVKEKIQGEFNQQPGWQILAIIEEKLDLLKAIP